MYSQSGPHVMGRPITLTWAGWTTDTYRLQQNGWEISAHQDPLEHEMGIAIRHEQHRVQGLTRIERFEYERMFRSHEDTRNVRLPINLANRLHLQLPWSLPSGPMAWGRIDAFPQVVHYQGEDVPKGFEELFHFRPMDSAPRQIIVPDESIDALLEKILKQQEPEKQRYFEEKVRRERNAGPVPTLHAQILSFPQRAAA